MAREGFPMKYTFVALVLAAFLVSTLATTPAKAASKSDGSVQLQANDEGNKNAKNDEVVNGEDKPKRSKKNDDRMKTRTTATRVAATTTRTETENSSPPRLIDR